MRRLIFFFFCLAALAAPSAWGQQLPTASRAGDLQVGGGFSFAKPDYTEQTFKGYSFYADFDFKAHWGIEADFHQVYQPSGDPRQQLYERTYEIGGRYLRRYGRFSPYAKLLYGRGVFNFGLRPTEPVTDPHPNLAFNIFTPGGGVDFHLNRFINIRGDYEYQFWPSFPPNGLQPSVITIGAAYHFH